MKKWFRHVVFVIYVTIAFFASNLGDIPSLFSHKNLGGDNSLYAAQKKVAEKKAATKKIKQR